VAVWAVRSRSIATASLARSLASLLFRDPRLSESVFEAPVARPYADPNREAQTNLQLVSLDVVADRTAKRLGALSGDDVSDKVEVISEGQSDVVSIQATEPEPARAARLANVFADEYRRFRREADRSKVRDAQLLLERKLESLSRSERNGMRGRSLEDRAEQLEVLTALQTGNVELVQTAEPPSSPSSPEPVRNTALGGALGLLLGLGLAFLLERLDRRVKTPEELEAIFARRFPRAKRSRGQRRIRNTFLLQTRRLSGCYARTFVTSTLITPSGL